MFACPATSTRWPADVVIPVLSMTREISELDGGQELIMPVVRDNVESVAIVKTPWGPFVPRG
jgi:hypothetical protein